MTRLAGVAFLSAIACLAISTAAAAGEPLPVRVEIAEGVPDKKSWDFAPPTVTDRYQEAAFAFAALPTKYSSKGIPLDRSSPFLVRASCSIALPAGDYRVILRSRNAARVWIDDNLLGETAFITRNGDGHEPVPEPPAVIEPDLRPPGPAVQEKLFAFALDGKAHAVRLEAFVGGQKLRLEVGELVVAIAAKGGTFQLLSPDPSVPLTYDAWESFTAAAAARLRERDRRQRFELSAGERDYWTKRHDIARRAWADHPAPALPKVSPSTPALNDIDRFLGQKLEAKGVAPSPLADDWTFLRRVALDTVGVIPSPAEIAAFVSDRNPDRRAKAIDRYLADDRWADRWVGYWQDVLAENPGILKPTLNNTGPFRWWIYHALRDGLPMDRFVTELVMMEGSSWYGGPAGFAVATQNDAPMAAKAHVLAKAFLGLEMQCARCHDAPYHPYKQEELFQAAAMLLKGPQKVPATSTVPKVEGGRQPRVNVTLAAGSAVEPKWPFGDLSSGEIPDGVVRDPNNARERFAALLTGPQNARFAQVLVNRLWKVYLGHGLVEPVDDWHSMTPSHPELLDYLAREFITHNYDPKHVARLILNSHAYQREVRPERSRALVPEDRLLAAPPRRRLSAEQLVDSLFAAVGKEFRSEELTMDPEGRRPVSEMINLGVPTRAWQFTSLSNERDRPALALPAAQGIVDLMTAFGWRDSRQNPITVRDETPTPLQPLLLANGLVGSRIVSLSDDGAVTDLALADGDAAALVERVYLRVLSRPPRADEAALFTGLLREGFADRRAPGWQERPKSQPKTRTNVSWANHLSPEATRIKLEMERAARAGDPPTTRLRAAWRDRMEDMLWALVNSPEFMFVP